VSAGGEAAAAAAQAPEPWMTGVFAGLLAAMIACLALEDKLHAKKSVIVGAFAALALLGGAFCGFLPLGMAPVLAGHELHLPYYVTGVDWEVIAIILGSSIFVDVTSKSGLFTWIAIKLTKASGGDPLRLLWCYAVMTVVFSAVLNNVTAMIIVGSLSGVSLARLERKDLLLGFLLIEGLLTNIGGLLTLISSVPNIIVGTAAGISFVEFFLKSAIYVAVAAAITVFLGARIFAIRALADDAARAAAAMKVAGFDETDGIPSDGFFRFGAVNLILFIVAIAATSSLPGIAGLGMGFVAMFFALVMLLRYRHEAERFYKAVDWDLLAFFVFLFVTIGVMEHAGVLALIGRGLAPIIALDPNGGVPALLTSAAVASSVTDNIPLAAMLARILEGEALVAPAYWWSVIFGANLGGNLTPIGSASTLVAVTIMHKQGVGIGFAGFVRKALPFAAVHIVLAILYVLIAFVWL